MRSPTTLRKKATVDLRLPFREKRGQVWFHKAAVFFIRLVICFSTPTTT